MHVCMLVVIVAVAVRYAHIKIKENMNATVKVPFMSILLLRVQLHQRWRVTERGKGSPTDSPPSDGAL